MTKRFRCRFENARRPFWTCFDSETGYWGYGKSPMAAFRELCSVLEMVAKPK